MTEIGVNLVFWTGAKPKRTNKLLINLFLLLMLGFTMNSHKSQHFIFFIASFVQFNSCIVCELRALNGEFFAAIACPRTNEMVKKWTFKENNTVEKWAQIESKVLIWNSCYFILYCIICHVICTAKANYHGCRKGCIRLESRPITWIIRITAIVHRIHCCIHCKGARDIC